MVKIAEGIFYVGVDDHKTELFEGMYPIPNGVSYNSYVLSDEKIAVMDSVDAGFTEEWLNHVSEVLNGRTPDFLVVQHMEPDHSGSVHTFMEQYPETVLVASAKAFQMLYGFFGTAYENRRIVVKEGDRISLGEHKLYFLEAPFVHWPEVIMTYEETQQVLFSADGFGKFSALDIEEAWEKEARRYYFNIVGKFGAAVQKVLKKVEVLPIRKICPLHGPVLSENLSYYLELYHKWSSYEAESDGILIAYASVYGNTKKAAEVLAELLKEKGRTTELVDLCRDDRSAAVGNAFHYETMVLASVTYNGTILPPMREFLSDLVERNYQNRTVAFVENGSWAPGAAQIMRHILGACRTLHLVAPAVTIRGALSKESLAALSNLAEELCSWEA